MKTINHIEVTRTNLPNLPYSYDPIREDVCFVLAVSGVHKLKIRRWFSLSFLKNQPKSISPRVQDFITRKCSTIRAEIAKGKWKSVHTLSVFTLHKDGLHLRNIKP